MFGYPNFSFPFYRNYNRYNRYSLNPTFMKPNPNRPYPPSIPNQFENKDLSRENISNPGHSTKNNSNEQDRNVKSEKSSQNEFLEIFGIKLYFDDLMIISLLFFLYSEGVNDYYLFITLILLLLT